MYFELSFFGKDEHLFLPLLAVKLDLATPTGCLLVTLRFEQKIDIVKSHNLRRENDQVSRHRNWGDWYVHCR